MWDWMRRALQTLHLLTGGIISLLPVRRRKQLLQKERKLRLIVRIREPRLMFEVSISLKEIWNESTNT